MRKSASMRGIDDKYMLEAGIRVSVGDLLMKTDFSLQRGTANVLHFQCLAFVRPTLSHRWALAVASIERRRRHSERDSYSKERRT